MSSPPQSNHNHQEDRNNNETKEAKKENNVKNGSKRAEDNHGNGAAEKPTKNNSNDVENPAHNHTETEDDHESDVEEPTNRTEDDHEHEGDDKKPTKNNNSVEKPTTEKSVSSVPADYGEEMMCDTPYGETAQIRVKKCANSHHEQGAFGYVVRAKIYDRRTPTLGWPDVAMKIMKLTKAEAKKHREICILRELANAQHDNIILMLYSKQEEHSYEPNIITYTLIFPFVKQTLDNKIINELATERNYLDMKLYAWQLFAALHHLESHEKLGIIHRDIKPQNLLVDTDTGRLFVADFGSAKHASNRPPFNNYYAFTRPYRPPELCLEAVRYGCMADIWSAGCVFAELYYGRPNALCERFLAGEKGQQLQVIYSLLGTPTRREIRAMRARKFFPAIEEKVVWPLQALTTRFKEKGIKDADSPAPILEQILRYDPKQRLHGRALLTHAFFDPIFEPGKMRTYGAPVADSRVILTRKQMFG